MQRHMAWPPPERGAPSGDGFALSGRDAELLSISEALTDADRGRGRAFLIAGEPGIGKTTLCEAATELGKREGFRTFWGAAWESGGAPALWPWVQVLRDIIATSAAENVLEKLPGSHRATLARLVPEISVDEVQQPEIETEQARFAMFDAVARLLHAVADEAPLAIVLDDMHAADVASVLLLRFVARDIRGMRAVVMANYRESEARGRPEIWDALRDSARDATSLPLEGLEADDLSEMIESTLGMKPSGALLTAIHELTGGNPFYVDEIIKLLQREGSIEQRIDLTRSVLPVPDSVSATVLRRMAPLPEEVRDVLQVASVLGREFDDDVLAAVSGQTTTAVRAALDVARAEDVVVRHATAARRYLFAHALFRESLYDALTEQQRSLCHLQIAEILEARMDASGSSVAEVAHHYLAAGDLADLRKTFDHAVAAGRRAREMLAFEEAADFFERASLLIEETQASAEEKGDVLVALGDALLRSGKIPEGKQVLDRAIEHARTTGAGSVLVSAVLAVGYLPIEGGVVDRELIQLSREAIELLGSDDDVIRARLMARMAGEYMFAREEREIREREELVRESISLARRGGSKRDVAHLLRFGIGLLSPDTSEECFHIANEILDLGEELDDPEFLYSGHLRRLTYFLEFGQASELFQGIDAMSSAARKVRHPVAMWGSAAVRAMHATMRGDFEAAEREAAEALDVGSDFPNALGANIIQSYLMRWERDIPADLLPILQIGGEQRPGIRDAWKSAEVGLLARVGRTEEARAGLSELVDRVASAPKNSLWLSLHSAFGVAVSLLDDARGAEVAYEALLPYQERVSHTPMGGPVVCWGAISLTLAQCARVLKRWDDAIGHFEAAVEMHARLGARPYLARTQLDFARTLFESGRALDRAGKLLRESELIGRELGLDALIADADEVAKLDPERGKRTAGSESAEGGSASLVQEGEYVTFTFDDEIARLRRTKGIDYLALLLSRPGAEIHVLDLVTPGAREGGMPDPDLSLGGDDAGPALDPAAKAAYRQRVDHLREELEEAEAFNDPERAARAREEMDAILEQLAGAVGLGGRDRKLGSSAERARVNVTKRIRATMDKVAEGSPRLGRHLKAAIKTGTFLSYSGETEALRTWEISLS